MALSGADGDLLMNLHPTNRRQNDSRGETRRLVRHDRSFKSPEVALLRVAARSLGAIPCLIWIWKARVSPHCGDWSSAACENVCHSFTPLTPPPLVFNITSALLIRCLAIWSRGVNWVKTQQTSILNCGVPVLQSTSECYIWGKEREDHFSAFSAWSLRPGSWFAAPPLNLGSFYFLLSLIRSWNLLQSNVIISPRAAPIMYFTGLGRLILSFPAVFNISLNTDAPQEGFYFFGP